MFGAGWTEMLIIGVVALVVIGPKDLPIVMRRVGRMVGTVRRMGSEFQRELNKTTGLDQIADLRRSITEPLRQTSEEIAREFNRQTSTGVEPSGVLKPADPAVESVYDQIAATSGVSNSEPVTKAPPPVMKPMAPMPEPSPAPAEASAPVIAAKPKAKRSGKPKGAAAPVAAEVLQVVAAPVRKRTVKPKALATAPAATSSVPAVKPAARTRAKPAADAAPAAASATVPETIPAAKPARRRAAKA